MSKFKESVYRFFRGRYGTDSLNSFLLWSYFAAVLINLFTGLRVFSYIGLACGVAAIYRMLSRNIYKRQQENIKFFNLKKKITQKFKLTADKWKYRKTHIYRNCPSCKATLKLPKIKGQHTCCCPRCKNSFKVFCG